MSTLYELSHSALDHCDASLNVVVALGIVTNDNNIFIHYSRADQMPTSVSRTGNDINTAMWPALA